MVVSPLAKFPDARTVARTSHVPPKIAVMTLPCSEQAFDGVALTVTVGVSPDGAETTKVKVPST